MVVIRPAEPVSRWSSSGGGNDGTRAHEVIDPLPGFEAPPYLPLVARIPETAGLSLPRRRIVPADGVPADGDSARGTAKKNRRPEASEVVEEPDDVGEVNPVVAVVVERGRRLVSSDPSHLDEVQDDVREVLSAVAVDVLALPVTVQVAREAGW